MLPLPAAFSARRSKYRRLEVQTYNHKSSQLLQRARITNLGLVLLLSLTCLSLLFNLSHFLSSPGKIAQRGFAPIPTTRPGLDHLIMVPGHAIWTGSDPDNRLNEDDWILEDYQKGGGRVDTFYKHIEYGSQLAAHDDRALLVFSGGQTRPGSTSTEGESYFRLALLSKLASFGRTTTENYALDSYQNLIFSIARFHEFTGRYPNQITVVGYGMKRERFEKLHRAALRWPSSRFNYVGIDAPGEHAEVAKAGELKNGFQPYSKDIYGCHSPLVDKRLGRNPHARFHSYYQSSPELGGLLDWCPHQPKKLYSDPLPWDGLY